MTAAWNTLLRATSAFLALQAAIAFSQEPALTAHRLTADESIKIDGRLDEAAWFRAPVFDRFYEIGPADRGTPSVRTEARLLVNAKGLYFGIRAFDPKPAEIQSWFTRRDGLRRDQDFVVVNVDPLGTRKFAHFVRVNAVGSVADGLYSEDSGNEDFSPDFEFSAAAHRDEQGYSVELYIPFTSLRYGDPPPEKFSVLLFRNYPRDQRYRFASSPLPRESNCFLCLNIPIEGLNGVPTGRVLTLTPNATLRSVTDRVDGVRTRKNSTVASLDLKWRPRPEWVLDGTINPDFSQVELDSPQLAANTQFALFFPEKRPFFLESADILEAPMNAVYTRSITDPSWGARATYRSERAEATLLTSRDQGKGLILLPGTYGTNFALQSDPAIATIARGRFTAGHARIGGTITSREIQGGGYNRVIGPDAVWKPDEHLRVRGQFLHSITTALFDQNIDPIKGQKRDGQAAVVDVAYNVDSWSAYWKLEGVTQDFRADSGFFGESGYRYTFAEFNKRFREVGPFNFVSPFIKAELKLDESNNKLYQGITPGIYMNGARDLDFTVELRPNSLTRVRPDSDLKKRDQFWFSIGWTPGHFITRIDTDVAIGDRLDVAGDRIGKGVFITNSLRARLGDRLEWEQKLDNAWIDSRQPVAEGSKRILHERAFSWVGYYHLTARDSIRLIAQLSSVRRAPSLYSFEVPALDRNRTYSLLYGHRYGLGSTLYVGATRGNGDVREPLFTRSSTEVFVKGSLAFDL